MFSHGANKARGGGIDDRCVICAVDGHDNGRGTHTGGGIRDGVCKGVAGALADGQIVVKTSDRGVNELDTGRGRGVQIRCIQMHAAVGRVGRGEAFDQVWHGIVGQHIKRHAGDFFCRRDYIVL